MPINPKAAGALLALALLAPLSLDAQRPITVVQGGTLIDGAGGPPLKDAVIVIEGERIRAVGAQGSVQIPAGARIVDASGLTVLPGLIDAHIHSLDFFPPLFLHFGVTTVCDTANPTDWIIAQRDALKAGRIKGPRMFVSGVVIDGPDDAEDRRDEYRTHVSTPEEARAVARTLLRRGVDVLKVYQHLTPELLTPIVEEAHRAGTEAVGHSHDAVEAVTAGLKFIEHTTPIAHSTLGDPGKVKAMDTRVLREPYDDMDSALFGPLIDLMVKNGVFYNPTLTREWISVLSKRDEWYAEAATLLQRPEYGFIPAARREAWLSEIRGKNWRGEVESHPTERGLRKVEEFTRRYAQAGGRIIAGPDSGPSSGPANMAGLALHVEMEALVDAGLTPMHAIQSSTKWPAELLHKAGDLGTIAPGRIADLILVEGDPLADIRATRKIHVVMMNGAIVDTALDPAFRNPLPRPVAEYSVDSRNPELEALTPNAARQGQANVRLELTGRKFTRRSVVRFDTADLATTFVSESKLVAIVDSKLLKQPGTYAVTVVTPGPAGGVSRPLNLVVNYRE